MQNKNFRYVDDCAFIRLVDSFVKVNKFGTGNGEAALYLGSKNDPDIFSFFENDAFSAHCVLLKNEVIDYLNDVKEEYRNNRFLYRSEVSLDTWNKNYNEILSLPDKLYFDLTRKRQFDKNGRVYAQELTYKRKKNLSILNNHKAYVYDLIRRIAIPEVSFIMLTKLDKSEVVNFHASLYYDPNFE